MIIYGAGMSGLLAAQMLKRHNPVVMESQSSLPNNHAALLRFRTDAVERATGIKLKKVYVQKAVLEHPDGLLTTSPNIQLQNMYSMKVTGGIRERSIMNCEAGERYIAPDDFCERLAEGVTIQYNENLKSVKFAHSDAIISTIPMPALMKIAGWSDMPKFDWSPITTISAKLSGVPCDVYQTIYIPFISMPAYRLSITGDNFIIEMMGHQSLDQDPAEAVLHHLRYFFGGASLSRIVPIDAKIKRQEHGKLNPTNNSNRKEFILAMTDLYNIYALGRFGTWRQILMDDVVKDVKLIEAMIEERSGYARKLKYGM